MFPIKLITQQFEMPFIGIPILLFPDKEEIPVDYEYNKTSQCIDYLPSYLYIPPYIPETYTPPYIRMFNSLLAHESISHIEGYSIFHYLWVCKSRYILYNYFNKLFNDEHYELKSIKYSVRGDEMKIVNVKI